MSSYRQQIAVQKISENIRKGKSINMGFILRESGYSKQTSLKPKLVTETKGFREEMDKIVSDVKLVNTHRELLDAYVLKTMTFDSKLSDEEIKEIVESRGICILRDISRNNHQARCNYWVPDHLTRLKALDIAYKLKNLYPSKKHQTSNDLNIVVKKIDYNNGYTD